MLTPNASYKINGVTVNEHIIPDAARKGTYVVSASGNTGFCHGGYLTKV